MCPTLTQLPFSPPWHKHCLTLNASISAVPFGNPYSSLHICLWAPYLKVPVFFRKAALSFSWICPSTSVVTTLVQAFFILLPYPFRTPASRLSLQSLDWASEGLQMLPFSSHYKASFYYVTATQTMNSQWFLIVSFWGFGNLKNEAHNAKWCPHPHPIVAQRCAGASSPASATSLSSLRLSLSVNLPLPELKAEHKRLRDLSSASRHMILERIWKKSIFFHLSLASLVQLFTLFTSSYLIYSLPWNPQTLCIWGIAVRAILSSSS